MRDMVRILFLRRNFGSAQAQPSQLKKSSSRLVRSAFMIDR
jgi:hypothetical protein